MALSKDPPTPPAPDHLDGYQPKPLGSTAPVDDPAVLAAARADAEAEQTRRGVRWDERSLDGFINYLTGFGDPYQDKLRGGTSGALTMAVQFLAGTECEDRWRGSDLGGRVIEQVPAEMTRAGFELTIQPDDDEDLDDSDGLSAALERRIDSMRDRPDVNPHVWLGWAREMRGRLREFRRQLRSDFAPPPGATPSLPGKAQDPPGVSTGTGGEPPPPQLPPAPDLPHVDEESQRIAAAVETKLRELGALDAFREAAEYERAYGGAGILLGVDDVLYDMTQPLDETNIGDITHLTVFRGGWDGELIAWRYYNDPRRAKFGLPEVYMLRNLGVPISAPPAPGENPGKAQVIPVGPAGALTFYVHESRFLLFPGKAVSRRARQQMRGWGDTVFMRVNEVLEQYSQTWQAISTIMLEWALGVLKMKGLADMFAAQGDPQAIPSAGGVGPAPLGALGMIAQRIRAINMSKSNARTLLIDGDEEFRREVASLTGLAEVLEAFMLRLASAVDMPVSLLMGQSPGGLRAGDDDVRFFYDRIMSKIISMMMPQWRRLIRLIFLSKKTSPTGGKEPRKWDVTPRPLRSLNEKEEAERRKLVAETDAMYLDRGVVTVPEVTASRFGGAKWSGETFIDFEGRMRMRQRSAAVAKLRAQARPAVGGGAGGNGAGSAAGTAGGTPPGGGSAARGELGSFDPPKPGTQTADPTPKPGTVAPEQGGAGPAPGPVAPGEQPGSVDQPPATAPRTPKP